jgi:hypothetical protein
VTASYGQTRPLEAGTLIDVADGQAIEHIDVKLSRTGVVAGRIADEFGEPMAGVQVAIVRFQVINGGRRPIQVATRSTNDIGEFRLFGFPPGQYYLTATLPRFQMADDRANQPAYAPTYYPGTGSIAEAQRLAIAAGQVVAGMNMTLLPVRGMRVTGTVVDSSGRPASHGSVTLGQPTPAASPSFISGNLKPDGTFSLSNVTPGEYVIRWFGQELGERALAQVTVGGADVDGIVLVAVKAATIAGRITIDRAATDTIKPSEVRLAVGAVRPEDDYATASAGVPLINDDFTFQMKPWPGRLLITGGAVKAGWMAKAVRLNGADVTDTGLDVGVDGISGLQVEMTNIVSEVSGTVTDASGSPTRNAWVVVFTQDREKWRVNNRNVVAIRPDPTNEYRARTLRPGAYYAVAVAVDALEPGEWSDPDVLERLRARAVAVEIGQGERKTVNLTLTPLER